jgi:hypothetical protein
MRGEEIRRKRSKGKKIETKDKTRIRHTRNA